MGLHCGSDIGAAFGRKIALDANSATCGVDQHQNTVRSLTRARDRPADPLKTVAPLGPNKDDDHGTTIGLLLACQAAGEAGPLIPAQYTGKIKDPASLTRGSDGHCGRINLVSRGFARRLPARGKASGKAQEQGCPHNLTAR